MTVDAGAHALGFFSDQAEIGMLEEAAGSNAGNITLIPLPSKTVTAELNAVENIVAASCATELALEPGLRNPTSTTILDHGCFDLEQANRYALEDYVHRNKRMARSVDQRDSVLSKFSSSNCEMSI